MLVASKSGNISAARLINETDQAWTLEIENREYRVSKNDTQQRAFYAMSDALKWTGAEQELIEHFVALEAEQVATNKQNA